MEDYPEGDESFWPYEEPEPRHPDAYPYGAQWGPDNPAPGSAWDNRPRPRLRFRFRNAMRNHFSTHGLFARNFSHRRIFLRRRMRAARFSLEWHNYHDVRYLDVCIAHPRYHAWWAFSLTVYPSRGRGRQPVSTFLFGWIPSARYSWH